MSRAQKWAVIRKERPKMPWEGSDVLDAHLFGRYAFTHGTQAAMRVWEVTRDFAQIIHDIEAVTADPSAQESRIHTAFCEYQEQLAVEEPATLIEWHRWWKMARLIGGGMERRRLARGDR